MAPRRNASVATRAATTTTTTTTTKKPAGGAKSAKKKSDSASSVETRVKRKRDDAEGSPVPTKKTKTAAAAAAAATTSADAAAEPLNEVPSQVLDVFICGQGDNGELGLGSKKYNGKLRPTQVKRPRINHNLEAEKVGVLQVNCGGMHAIALTRDNKILTWGVNDDKALGRDTTWSGGLRDADADSDSDSDEGDDSGLNPKESTPGEVDTTNIPNDVKFIKVQASDSASFALTADGHVYGWGTFRGDDGPIGFIEGKQSQPIPTLLPHLSGIVDIAAGSNHVLALDKNGRVLSWGSGGQFQLGRRVVTRNKFSSLKPEAVGRFNTHRAVKVFACDNQSYYIDDKARVWSWGLNNYGQTGHEDGAGEDGSLVLHPKMIESLKDMQVNCVAAGNFHGVASTSDGKLLTWGRIDGHQVGQKPEIYTEDNTIFVDGKPRILVKPTVVPDISANFVAASSDTSYAISSDGKAYSWGFSAMYQTGLGTSDDVEVPTLIDNTAVKDKKINWAGVGGQFAILTAPHEKTTPQTNGTTNGLNGH